SALAAKFGVPIKMTRNPIVLSASLYLIRYLICYRVRYRACYLPRAASSASIFFCFFSLRRMIPRFKALM
ncbi:MAG: hypothetical protein ACI82H_001187, partial [Alphaproteobacteria bacterium]